MKSKEKSPRADIYERITEKIVADLEKGTRPWIKPWSAGRLEGRITRPLRHTGEPYTGMNILLLWSESLARGFESPLWMTYRQASQIGAQVRKGETGTTVVYASRFTKTETDSRGDEVERDIPFLKTYTVFNCDQIDGLPDHYYHRPDKVIDPVERIEYADRFFANTGAIIRHGGSKAFYAPASDHIQMPPFETFRDAASYVAVLSHEHVHNAVSRIMPHGRAERLRCLDSAMRRVGIIRVLRGRRAVRRSDDTALDASQAWRPERAPFPSAACRRGYRSGSFPRIHAQAKARSRIGRHRGEAIPSPCCGAACAE